WNRVQRGEHTSVINGKQVPVKEQDAAHGLITARNFGGTQKWRTCYVSDGTGHSMLYNVSNQTIAEQISVHERMEAIALIHNGERCYGAVVRNLMTGELLAYVARATCVASGGFGRIYRTTTNAVINQGIGTAIALETGVATLGNMEAVQFHPTAIFPAGILVTEGCRGDGGLLLDGKEHRFMPDYEPEKKELASRDVVSRWMETHIQKGHGAQSRFGEHLWLDIRLLGKKHIDSRLREVKEICHYFLGIDPVKELIPVRPAQHYSMGGIRTDYRGESPALKGLFAAGEAACWDLHGFNRLGGNSVAETVVAGMIVGEYMGQYLADHHISVSTALVQDFVKREAQQLQRFADSNGNENPFHILRDMQNCMTDKVSIFRNGERLEQAVTELRQLRERARNIRVRSSAPGVNPELVAAYHAEKMLKLALCVAYGALQRQESRGAHFREDFHLRNDRDWLNRTLATWKDGEPLPQLSYEALDVMSMELPPGWRGYGSKERIDHPDTPARQAQVEQAKASCKDRFELQETLMPYSELLPENLRGRNERLAEPLDDRTAAEGAGS
ncbi:MAG: fumarate reductase flavoprotein subunit, partial [Ketobacteraceae bacterium]|nr:fumarate reductase flavoprotein subunit [Ketobacteraceae bacterium]